MVLLNFLLSLCTSLCLQWEPRAIAVAFLYLAGKMAKFDIQVTTQSGRGRYWWRAFVDTLDVHDLDGELVVQCVY